MIDLYITHLDDQSGTRTKHNILNEDVSNLPYEENSVDRIYCSFALEHFSFHEAFAVVKHWYKILKPCGILTVETYNMNQLCSHFFNSHDENAKVASYPWFFGEPWINNGGHKFLYTKPQLKWTLRSCGFKLFYNDKNRRDDVCPHPLVLRIKTMKPSDDREEYKRGLKGFFRDCNEYFSGVLKEVKGFILDQAAVSYRKYVYKVKNGVVVDIGSFLGKSALAVADICRDQNNKLYCIDTWEGNPENQEGQINYVFPVDKLHEEFTRNVQLYGMEDVVIPLKMRAQDAAEKFRKENLGKADVIFIDAHCDYNEAKSILDSWSGLVKEGGIICGTNSFMFDIKRAVEESLDTYEETKGNFWYRRM